MFVSAPIPQLCLALSLEFEDRENSFKTLNHVEELQTTVCETNIEEFDKKLTAFVQRLGKQKSLMYYTAAFVSYYFDVMGDKELSDLFKQLMNENIKYSGEKIQDYDAGYLTGIFSSCLMADQNMNNNEIEVPKDIQEAINYIESEQFIVHLQKHDEKRT